MPEYLSVETYSNYPRETLSLFLDNSRQLLKDLGYAGENMETWLTQIAWEPDGGGFGLTLEPPAALEKVKINGHTLLAMPIADGWTPKSVPNLQETWVSLSLAFETQTERQNLDTEDSFSANYTQNHRYQPGVGKAMWSIMRQCAALFPQPLVYFTNEAQTGKSWDALLTDQEGLWKFEVALIPRSFITHFIPIPDQFARIDLPEGIGFAHTPRWSVLPWEE
jgi:hypothetical protein